MSDVIFLPAQLAGTLAAPPSKSAAHRALLSAALSRKAARVAPVALSADMEATLQALAGMGGRFRREEDAVVFSAIERFTADTALLDCGESGSTLRFLLPVAAALGIRARFTGAGRLPGRPLEPLLREMKAHGVRFSADSLPLEIEGRLRGGRFSLPGNISSQFITGLLFALPLLEEGGEIALEGQLESAGYVQLTLRALVQAGIVVEPTTDGWRLRGGQRYRGGTLEIEGDYSNAAVWLCAGALAARPGKTVAVTGLAVDSAQGDCAVLPLLERFGAAVVRHQETVEVGRARLHGCRIDAAPIPDLIPALAALAVCAEGDTEFYNAGRLRIKESDRLASTAALLRGIGGAVDEFSDRLVVHGSGGRALAGGSVSGANDHRIVMSAALAALGCEGPVRVTDAQAVGKSYPNFYQDYEAIGGKDERECRQYGETI